MKRLYYLSIKDIKNDFDTLLEKVTPNRQRAIVDFCFIEDKLRCLGAGLLLRNVLGIKTDDMISYGEFGKPELKANRHNKIRFHFNLSHSGNYVMLGINNCEIGVDIEKLITYDGDLAKFCFQDDECDYIARDSMKFTKLWTMKESIMKACGKGLSLHPKSFGVLSATDTGYHNINGVKWCVKTDVFSDKYVYSVCTKPNVDFFTVGDKVFPPPLEHYTK